MIPSLIDLVMVAITVPLAEGDTDSNTNGRGES